MPQQAAEPSIRENRRILVVDDQSAIHQDFRKILVRDERKSALDVEEAALFGEEEPAEPKARVRSFEVDSAFQGQEALAKVEEALRTGNRYALMFVDMRMPPGWDGVQTVERIWNVDPELQIVICTAYSDYSWEELVARFGAADRILILKKPFDTAEVCQLAGALTAKWSMARHAHLKMNQLKSMVDEQTQALASSMVALEKEVVERRRSQDALRESEERYALAAAGAKDGLWDWDLASDTVFFSARWRTMIGLPQPTKPESLEDWLGRVHAEDRPRLDAALQEHFHERTEQFVCEYRMLHADGQYRWMLARGVAVRGEDGKARRIAGSQTDITDRKLAEEQLRHDSHHDALTGLPNRSLLTDRLGRSMARKHREPGHRFGVLFLDLDGFKKVNDTLGHHAGDELLSTVARRLQACVREVDTVAAGPRDPCVARLGGDEFVIVLEGIRAPVDAIRVAERIQQAVTQPIVIDGHEARVGTSIGIAISDGYERSEDILRDADAALYAAKEGGRGRYVVFDPNVHEAATARWKMEGEFREGLASGQVKLVYLPIVEISTGKIAGFEALARWEHPRLGTLSPDEFLPVAEEGGLLGTLGAAVMRMACTQLAEWMKSPGLAPDVYVSVNLSARQLVSKELAQETWKVLTATGLAPHRLKLELTESALLDRTEAATASLARLRELGLRIHLDDFGTGYSSFSRLYEMPVEALKIDRSFVAAMTEDETSAAIVKLIVTLAKTMGVGVIAEGVETKEQLAALGKLGCNHAQGFFFASPQQAEKLAALLTVGIVPKARVA
ncbi:MAG: EAL domain-containing protein [Deltaproteobacteria bacterium]|nr:EAL domain-containing protein [Deltaproteobacteria bacterium]